MSLNNCKNCDREFKEEYELNCSSCGSVGCATCDRNPEYYHLVTEYCYECEEDSTDRNKEQGQMRFDLRKTLNGYIQGELSDEFIELLIEDVMELINNK